MQQSVALAVRSYQRFASAHTNAFPIYWRHTSVFERFPEPVKTTWMLVGSIDVKKNFNNKTKVSLTESFLWKKPHMTKMEQKWIIQHFQDQYPNFFKMS